MNMLCIGTIIVVIFMFIFSERENPLELEPQIYIKHKARELETIEK